MPAKRRRLLTLAGRFVAGLLGAANAAFAVGMLGCATVLAYRTDPGDWVAWNGAGRATLTWIALCLAAMLPAAAGALAGLYVAWRAESPATARWRRWLAFLWLPTAILAVGGCVWQIDANPVPFRPNTMRTVPTLLVALAIGLGLLPQWWLLRDAWRHLPRAQRGPAGWALAAVALAGLAFLCQPVVHRYVTLRRMAESGARLKRASSQTFGTVGMALFCDAKDVYVNKFDARSAAVLAGFDIAEDIRLTNIVDPRAAWSWIARQRSCIEFLRLTGGDFSFLAPADLAAKASFVTLLADQTWRWDTVAALATAPWADLSLDQVTWAPSASAPTLPFRGLAASATPAPPGVVAALNVRSVTVDARYFAGWARTLAFPPAAAQGFGFSELGLLAGDFAASDGPELQRIASNVPALTIRMRQHPSLATVRMLGTLPTLKALVWDSPEPLVDPATLQALRALRGRGVALNCNGAKLTD